MLAFQRTIIPGTKGEGIDLSGVGYTPRTNKIDVGVVALEPWMRDRLEELFGADRIDVKLMGRIYPL